MTATVSIKIEEPSNESLNNLLIINYIPYQKWFIRIDLVIHNEFTIKNAITLIIVVQI